VLHGIEEAQKERVKAAEVIHTLTLELHLLVIELYLLALELYLGLDFGCKRLWQSNTRQIDRIPHLITDCTRPRVKQGSKILSTLSASAMPAVLTSSRVQEFYSLSILSLFGPTESLFLFLFLVPPVEPHSPSFFLTHEIVAFQHGCQDDVQEA
jgi:hypothetical protein